MIYDLFMWLADSLLTVWFFRALKQDSICPARRWGAFTILLLALTIYWSPVTIHATLIRYLIRWPVVTLFLWLKVGRSLPICLYFSLLFSSSLAAIQSIQPLIDYFLHYTTPAVKAVSVLTEFLGLTIVSHFIPFSRIQSLRPIQPAVMGVITPLILYSKYTTGRITRGWLAPSTEVFVFPAVVLLLSLIVLALFDRFIVLTDEQQKNALISLSQDYQYQNLQAQLTAQDDVRRVYHDMKNHLLTIQAMSTDQQKGYIQDLLAETDSYGLLFHTGNETLDGLLHAKLLDAKSRGVHLSVNVDLSPVDYLEPVDVCAIFGNVIDNAIEASEKLSDPADRFVEIKSGPFADHLAIRVMNSCVEGSVHLKEDQTMETTKRDKSRHGIGLSSVRHSVEKYGGVLSLHTTPNHRLLLTILLPCPPADGN